MKPNLSPESTRDVVGVENQAEALVRGRVIDEHGRGIPQVVVGLIGADFGQWTTDDDGRFEVADSKVTSAVVVKQDGFVTLLQGERSSDLEMTIVAAPTRSVGGIVVDHMSGTPIPKVKISLAEGVGWTQHIGQVSRWDGLRGLSAETDELGLFEFPEVADLLGCTLSFTCDGYYGDTSVVIGTGEQPSLLVSLDSTLKSYTELDGIVLMPNGSEAPGALVGTAGVMVATGQDGRFRLVFERPDSPSVTLRAVVSGVGIVEKDVALPSEDIVLQLSHASKSQIRVLDGSGRPVKNAVVEVLDKSVIGRRPIPGLPEGLRGDLTEEVYLEDELHSRSAVLRTGADGVVEILNSPCTIRVVDSLTLAEGEFELTDAPNQDVVLDISQVQKWRFQIVDLLGTPMPDVHVGPWIPISRGMVPANKLSTDQNGHVELLLPVGLETVRLDFDSETLFSSKVVATVGEKQVEVPRRLAVRFHWNELPKGTQFSGIDADEVPQALWQVAGNGSFGLPWLSVEGEISPVVFVSQAVVGWRYIDHSGGYVVVPYRFGSFDGAEILDVYL